VAGIAAAVTDNGIGVAGVAPDAHVMPVRVLDADGSGSSDDVAAGIVWAADHGADVINLSLGELPIVGQLEPLNQEIEAAVTHAWNSGSLVVAAAGNETFPLCSYPSFADHAVCVGATDRRGLPSYYSNFPNNKTMLGFRAPGGVGSIFCEDDEDIWSTMWPGSSYDCTGSGSLSGYDTLAGTSMASPQVAGVAALLAGQGLTNQQIVDRLKATSSNHGAYDPVMGYGIVDADAATR
jgi:subtilisin family serine protease